MHIILGATGHIGSSLAAALLARGEPVTVIVRDPKKAEKLAADGAKVAVADAHDAASLRAVFEQGQRLFLLNPPGDPGGDTDVEERDTLAAIVAALEGSGLRKVVAQSTYGAQPGKHIGDLGVLHELEQALAASGIPTTVLRGAYYMSNWDMQLAAVQKTSRLESLYPVDFELPMVAPHDLGLLAARLMTEPVDKTGLVHGEGPARYRPKDVAAEFGEALKKQVTAVEVPRKDWQSWLRAAGFSEPAASSFVSMTERALEARVPAFGETEHGETTLAQYIERLVRAQSPGAQQH